MADELYHDALKALAEESRARGRLDHPDGTATVDNPLCGDRVTIDLALDGDRVTATGHAVRGCLLCEAGAAVVAATAPLHCRAELIALPAAIKAYLKDPEAAPPLAELAPFAPARRFRSRHRCVTLAFEALAKALA